MGGVDSMDGLMGRYHIRAKTRNVMMRIFYHLIDMAVTNSYILYHRIHAEKVNGSSDVTAANIKLLQLPEFREAIAASLVVYSDKRVIGRPSTVEKTRSHSPQPGPSKIGKKANHPVEDIRYDGQSHFPIWLDKESGKRKCKLCKTSKTQCICSKCDLHFCCSNAKNCFFDYHNKN